MLSDSISGNICFDYYFSLNKNYVYKEEESPEDFGREVIKNNFKNCCDINSENCKGCNALQEIKISQNFLYNDKLPFGYGRWYIEDYKLSLDNFIITHSGILISIYPSIRVINIKICISFEKVTSDQLIYIKQITFGDVKYTVYENEQKRNLSTNELFNILVDKMIKDKQYISEPETSCTLEIKEFNNYDNIEEILKKESKKIYGLLTGDEGWAFVPLALADERMKIHWGSRQFVKFITFRNNFLYFNLNKCNSARKYDVHQKEFMTNFYGVPNPYFELNASIAGVDHGILFATESAMAIKALSIRILKGQLENKQPHFWQIGNEIRRIKEYRKEIIDTLTKVEKVPIAELSVLEDSIFESLKISPIIEKLKSLLEVVESELDLLFKTSTNNLVTLLTIIGIIIAIIGIM